MGKVYGFYFHIVKQDTFRGPTYNINLQLRKLEDKHPHDRHLDWTPEAPPVSFLTLAPSFPPKDTHSLGHLGGSVD